jgi:acyl CoA:acetate/3-ketoacid CoA transferase beta subunit
VVKLVATDLGLFEVTPDGFVLREYAPGWTPEEIQHLTEATLIVPRNVQAFRCRN